jgi:hypothetical protein
VRFATYFAVLAFSASPRSTQDWQRSIHPEPTSGAGTKRQDFNH